MKADGCCHGNRFGVRRSFETCGGIINTPVQKDLGSKLCPDMVISVDVFSWYYSVPPGNCPDSIPNCITTDSCTSFAINFTNKKKTNSVALSPQANHIDWATVTCWRNWMPTFADKGVSRGQRAGSPTVINLSFLDRSRYFLSSSSSFIPTRAEWIPFQTHCYSENLVEPGIERGTPWLPARNSPKSLYELAIYILWILITTLDKP
jgi:hypothetical protein